MRSQSSPRPKRSTRRSPSKTKRPPPRPSGGWISWWPLAAGIAITVVAVKTAEILPLTGPGGLFKLQLIYPFALLVKQTSLGLAEQTGDHWSQIMLYAQFVLYGLYASIAIYWTTRSRALLQLAAVHVSAFAALWVLSNT